MRIRMTIYLAAPLDVKPAEKSILDEGVSEGVSEGVKNLFSLIIEHPSKRTPFFSKRPGNLEKALLINDYAEGKDIGML